MWTWAHLGVAYLLYSYSTHRRFDRPPEPAPAIALVLGSQLPDLIDKPLAWGLGVLPSGRSLAHSLFFAAAVLSLLYVVTRRLGRLELLFAYAVGHLSHLVTDLPPGVLLGYPRGSEYLLWPLLSLDAFGDDQRLFAVPTVLEIALFPLVHPASYQVVQLGLFVVAAAAWYRDGLPGLEFVPFVRGGARIHREGGE